MGAHPAVAGHEDNRAAGVVRGVELLARGRAEAARVGQALHPGSGGAVIDVHGVRAGGQHVNLRGRQRGGRGREGQRALCRLACLVRNYAHLILQ